MVVGALLVWFLGLTVQCVFVMVVSQDDRARAYTMEAFFTFTQQRIYKMAGGRVIDNRVRKIGPIVACEGVTRVRPPLHIFANRCNQSVEFFE
jgi:hypothetical protein